MKSLICSKCGKEQELYTPRLGWWIVQGVTLCPEHGNEYRRIETAAYNKLAIVLEKWLNKKEIR